MAAETFLGFSLGVMGFGVGLLMIAIAVSIFKDNF